MALENTKRLADVGPLDPVHGFPLWFEDGDGTAVELGLGPDQYLPMVDEAVPSTPVPGMPFPSMFPAEAFYFLAESRMPIGGTGAVGRARLVLGLEAAFATPNPDPRSRVVFARIRVRIDDVVPGALYTVTHPYGVTDPLAADDGGRVFVTDDRGIADNQFDLVRANGLVAPFLRWTGGAPSGYLGDGATEAPVTGSPFNTNFFRVEGPGVANVPGALRDPADPLNPDVVVSPLFVVQGKITTRSGVEVTAAHYVRDGGTVVIDLHARSREGQTLEAGGVDVARTTLIGAGRSYVARAVATAPPAIVTVVNTSDAPPTVASAAVTDRVTATAVHDPTTAQLTITAFSSDDAQPALTAEDYGALTGPSTVFAGVPATPSTVGVSSAAGGRIAVTVGLTGPSFPALPLVADAGNDRAVLLGDEVVLDGTASRSGVTAWAWSQTAGPSAVIADPAAARTAVTVPGAGLYTFQLSVTAAGGTATAAVTVEVQPVVPDTVSVTRAEFRTGRDEFRVDGTQTGTRPATVTVRFRGSDLGSGTVDAAGSWSVRRSITPAENGLQPGVGDTLDVVSSRGGSATPAIRLRN